MVKDLKSFCDDIDKANALQAAVAEECIAKIKTFQAFFDAHTKEFVDFRNATGEDESAQQSKLIAIIHANQETHNKEFAAYTARVKKFVSP